MKLLYFSCLLLFVGFSVGFIPGVLRQFPEWTGSLTHIIITRAGLWSTVIEFLKDNPQYANENQIPGKRLASLKLPRLFKGHIPHWLSGLIKSSKFEDALKEIENANAEVDSKEAKFTASHFDAEQFRRSSLRLILLKRKVIALINKAGDNEADYSKARKETGRFLHTLQDFYSHSNWIEFGNMVPLRILGDELIAASNIAGEDEKTCTNCTYAKCKTNLILSTRKLTSGYFGGQDVVKPVSKGKCSHGGLFDSSRDEGATGGINKDSNIRFLSPHYRQHKKAAKVAINATKLFFDSIRATVGDENFAKFLNMKSFRTISFTIDTTGSMKNEIEGVQNATIQFIEDAANDDAQSFYYVLVPFNDPWYGPAHVTSDPVVAKAKVQSLFAFGGGNCPEMGMHGLYLTLVSSLANSDVYYFSDASAKDAYLVNNVISIALRKKCRIYLFISGTCSKRRRRRSVSQESIYKMLATSTGGQYFEISKSNINDVINLVGHAHVPGASSLTLHEVTLLAVQVDDTTMITDKSYNARSDRSVLLLTAVLSAEGNASIQVISPSGENENMTIITQTETVYAVRITKPSIGNWIFKITAYGKYALQVTAQSTIKFSASLEEEQESQTFEKIFVPISGNPIKGHTLLVTVVPSETDVLHVDRNMTGYCLDLKGNVLSSFELDRGEEYYNNSFYGAVKMNYDAFKILYEGYNQNNEMIQRLSSAVIRPQTFTMQIKLSSENDSLVINPFEKTSFYITLKNYGPKKNFSILVSDEKMFVESYSPKKLSLGSNESLDITINFLAMVGLADIYDSITSSVSISASVESLSSSSADVANFLSFEISVFSKEFFMINETEAVSKLNMTRFLIPPEEEEEDHSDEGLPTYGAILIAVCSVLVLSLVVGAIVMAVFLTKTVDAGRLANEKYRNYGYA